MSEPRPTVRPPMLTALGWIWIGLGTLLTLMSLMILAMTVLEPYWMGVQPGHGGLDHQEILLLGLGSDPQVLVLLPVSVAPLIAGIYLLRRREWARLFLEIFCWLGLALMIGGTVGGLHRWLTQTNGSPDDPTTAYFTALTIGSTLLGALFVLGPLCVLIWLLRHREVRGGVIRGSEAAE